MANTAKMVETGIDSKELAVLERALVAYVSDLEMIEKDLEKSIQRAIDKGNTKRVIALEKMKHRAYVERLNADSILFDLEKQPGEELARIIIVDRDQTKIE